ncbi:MAG: urease subunit beta [Nitrospinota bacterium]|nr:urease subunit beta [Nitrospinota bacterium]
MIPGEYILSKDSITLNKGRNTISVIVANRGDRPIQVGSHFHFFEVNRFLSFPREKAYGMRLNIPAGTAVRFEPGDEKEVVLVEFAGTKNVIGLNSLTEGIIDSDKNRKESLDRAKKEGFMGDLS